MLSKSETDFTKLMMHDFKTVDSDTNYLPFDMSLSLDEGFVASDANKQALQKAGELFKTEHPDQAVEVLNLAQIEVQVTAAMLPYEETITALDDALGDIEDGNYFTANLDLKSINDSVIVRNFAIDAIPVQGAAN